MRAQRLHDGRSLTGAWIETCTNGLKMVDRDVAPLRGRGLKHKKRKKLPRVRSRSLTGAWIETRLSNAGEAESLRRSLTGAWIETSE